VVIKLPIKVLQSAGTARAALATSYNTANTAQVQCICVLLSTIKGYLA
jgi:hypothetical protein